MTLFGGRRRERSDRADRRPDREADKVVYSRRGGWAVMAHLLTPHKGRIAMLSLASFGSALLEALFIVLLQVGLMSGTPVDLTLTQGMSFFAACIPTAIGGWLSAKFQGRVAAASVGIVAKHPEAATKGIIYCGIVEFYAILSLVATIMISLNIMK